MFPENLSGGFDELCTSYLVGKVRLMVDIFVGKLSKIKIMENYSVILR